jgi:hypothetical protein
MMCDSRAWKVAWPLLCMASAGGDVHLYPDE